MNGGNEWHERMWIVQTHAAVWLFVLNRTLNKFSGLPPSFFLMLCQISREEASIEKSQILFVCIISSGIKVCVCVCGNESKYLYFPFILHPQGIFQALHFTPISVLPIWDINISCTKVSNTLKEKTYHVNVLMNCMVT